MAFFHYRPHVHADGVVSTPDLLIGSVLVAEPEFGSPPAALGAERLGSAYEIALEEGMHGVAAAAFVGGRYGVIAAPALVIGGGSGRAIGVQIGREAGRCCRSATVDLQAATGPVLRVVLVDGAVGAPGRGGGVAVEPGSAVVVMSAAIMPGGVGEVALVLDRLRLACRFSIAAPMDRAGR